MNHKLAFILPRIAVVTLLAGLGALALFVVFKLLLMVAALALVVLAVKTAGRFIRPGRAGFEDRPYPGNVPITALRESDTIIPVAVKPKSAIIPIS